MCCVERAPSPAAFDFEAGRRKPPGFVLGYKVRLQYALHRFGNRTGISVEVGSMSVGGIFRQLTRLPAELEAQMTSG